MMKSAHFFLTAALSLVFLYTFGIGGTGNGILSPDLARASLFLLLPLVLAWWLLRWRFRWRWHRTPLDGLFIIWGVAFIVSFMANLDSARRIAIALWFMAFYAAVWYVLHDLLDNRAIKRVQMAIAVLFGGLYAIYPTFSQVFSGMETWLKRVQLAGLDSDFPRITGTVGNPNSLGTLLIALLPIAISLALMVRNRIIRVALILYVFILLFMLLFTYSRGAWIGGLGALIIWLCLILIHYNLVSFGKLRQWWSNLNIVFKVSTALIFITIIVSATLAVYFFVISLGGDSTRNIDARLPIYQAALRMFAEKPVFGHGLFTFGRGLAQTVSMPPWPPHSHAHNLPLQIAAELGIVGLIAFFISAYTIIHLILRNWQTLANQERLVFAGAIAAFFGIGIHHLMDFTAMMPAIALTGLVILILITYPSKPLSMQATWRRVGHPIAMFGLWAGLLGTGFWANNLYLKYDSVLQYARATNDYAGAASRLEPLIVSDPLLAALYYEQGFLYGMAANEGDKESAEKAIRAYQQFIDFEPHYATAYANLAALQWRSSEQDLAIQHMETAAALAWDNWSLNFEWGRYAEEVEKLAIARNAYETALTIQPDAALLTVWDETTLRQEIATSYLDSLSNLGTTAWQLKNRNITAARETWNAEEIDRRRLNNASSIPYIIHMLIALGEGKRDEAEHQWTMARATARNSQDGLWLGLGEAALARYDGDEALADEILNRVRQDIRIEPLGIDYPHGWNIIYAQFWRTAIPRQFLPQVNFVAVDPVLLYLLED